MHGPYTTQIQDRRERELARFSEEELSALPEGEAALRFYADASVGLVDGSLRRGVFVAAELLSAGEEAEVVVLGYEGSGSGEREYECRRVRVRRDERGRFLSTLGSRFNERVFVGV